MKGNACFHLQFVIPFSLEIESSTSFADRYYSILNWGVGWGVVPAFAACSETPGHRRKCLCDEVSKHIPGVVSKIILAWPA